MCVHHMPLYDDIIHYVYITSLYFMIVYMSHAPHIFYQNGKVAITPMSRSRNRYFL